MDLNTLPNFNNTATGIAATSLADIISDDCNNGQPSLLCPDFPDQSLISHQEENIVEKELAIMFLDLRNYTGLLQTGPAKEAVQLVKKLFNAFTRVVETFGGRVIDRAGDSLYVVFGLKTLSRIAADNALLAANMLFEVLAYVNARLEAKGHSLPLEIGIGMHAGEVIIEQQDGDNGYLSVMGLPVNIAARLQAETKTLNNDLILSQDFYLLLNEENRRNLNGEQRNTRLAGIHAVQQVWLAGKAYLKGLGNAYSPTELDYLLAIAG